MSETLLKSFAQRMDKIITSHESTNVPANMIKQLYSELKSDLRSIKKDLEHKQSSSNHNISELEQSVTIPAINGAYCELKSNANSPHIEIIVQNIKAARAVITDHQQQMDQSSKT
jgi:hypothetical protein